MREYPKENKIHHMCELLNDCKDPQCHRPLFSNRASNIHPEIFLGTRTPHLNHFYITTADSQPSLFLQMGKRKRGSCAGVVFTRKGLLALYRSRQNDADCPMRFVSFDERRTSTRLTDGGSTPGGNVRGRRSCKWQRRSEIYIVAVGRACGSQ